MVQLLHQNREKRRKTGRKSLRLLSQVTLLAIDPRTKMVLKILEMKVQSRVTMMVLQQYAGGARFPTIWSQTWQLPKIIIQSLARELCGSYNKDHSSQMLQ